MQKRRIILSLATLAISLLIASGQTTISVTQFGAKADSRKDVVPALNKAIAYCKGKKGSTITFPKGRYDFYAQPNSNTGISLRDMEGLTIDGQASDFVFHGVMKVSVVKNCKDITMKNFTVDWDRPFMSQGEIRNVSSRYIDVYIDASRYPYKISDGRIIFTGEGFELPPSSQYNNLYDKDTHEIVYDTRDAPLGNIFEQRAKQQKNGIVRFYGQTATTPAAGTLVAIRHLQYYEYGFDIQECRNITLSDIKIYHALSHAIHVEHTENITIDNAAAVCNEQKGRIFSSVTDNAHFVNCKGLIRIVNCEQSGAGDDFINIHGRYFRVLERKGDRTVTVDSRDVGIATGEEMWPVRNSAFSKKAPLTVRQCRLLQSVQGMKRYEVTFAQGLPKDIGQGDLLESKTWTPDVEISNCRITRRHRARGILVTSPGKVRIENNYFACAGAAIVIEGDSKNWYESGAVEDVVISANTFDNCFSSGNSNGSNGNWGNAIISITPSYQPTSAQSQPYHRNIQITGNTFKVFDAPILYARAVDGITYEYNKIILTRQYPQYTWQRSAFLLDGCRNVRVNNNMWDKEYPYHEARLMHMSRTDISTREQKFRVSSANHEGR